jgi:hypothetical protein
MEMSEKFMQFSDALQGFTLAEINAGFFHHNLHINTMPTPEDIVQAIGQVRGVHS